MRRNYLLLPLLGLLAVASAAPDDRRKFVRVITEPKPGEEYVSIHTGKPSSGVPAKHSEGDMDVNVNDEGQTGIKEVAGPVPLEEKIYAHKKLYPSNEEGSRRSKPEKKYTPITTEETALADGSFTKPINKLKNKRDGEIVATPSVQEKSSNNNHNNKEDDGLYDFVDAPFGSQIVGAASSQASRVNIKKAPNGQEYEYEYVYYYYDEDDENAKPGSKTSQQSTSNSPPSTQQIGSKPNKDVKDNTSKPKKPAVVQDENQFVQNTNRGRFSSVEHLTTTEEPEAHANFAVNDIAEHHSKTKESGRNLEEALSVPSSSVAVSEERLPHNPRFPARSRGNPRPTPQEIATTILPATDTPITRIRGGNGPHQPGLDLVDSNAFRTHSAGNGQHLTATSPRHENTRKPDAVVQTTPADQVATINNAYNTQLTETVPTVTETVVVNLDRNQDNTDSDAKGLSAPTTTLTPDEVAITVTQRYYTAGSTDKGAVDLYAILQQARSEETANAISSSAEHSTRYEDIETQYPTTVQRVSPTTTTTTTTTTTPASTTTTTTAASTRQSAAGGPVRSRYRGSAGTRNGGSPTPTTSTTTTEQPAASDEVTEKRKFKPSRERNPQGSVYSKRYQSSTATLDRESSTVESEVVTKAPKPSFGRQRTRASKPVSSTAAIDETVEVTSAVPKPNFAERSNLRRQNSRNKFSTSASTTTTTTALPQTAEGEESNASEQEFSEPTSTTAKAVGSRLRPNIRPLRPGLRLNFGGKGSSTTASPVPSTTQAHVSESSPDELEEKESVQETSPTPAPDSLSKLKNKSRFRVPEKQGALAAPKQQTVAPPATGQNRKHLLSNLLPKKKSIQTEEPPVLEEAKPVLENGEEGFGGDQVPESQNEDEAAQQPATATTTTSTTEAPTSSTNRLSSLLAKRRPLQRRPADFSRQSNQEE